MERIRISYTLKLVAGIGIAILAGCSPAAPASVSPGTGKCLTEAATPCSIQNRPNAPTGSAPGTHLKSISDTGKTVSPLRPIRTELTVLTPVGFNAPISGRF